MGHYIEKIESEDGKKTIFLPANGKVFTLIENGAAPINEPTQWQEGLVCVVCNGGWDAAAYAYDEHEMKRFTEGMEGRPYQWLLYPNAKKFAK